MSLVISFKGWCMIRLATDPDPSDEPRGVSGYTFAYPGEPDLDRIVQFHPPDCLERLESPDFGVFVCDAYSTDSGDRVDALTRAPVFLDGEPKLENRNWTLTLPGREPIVPFKLRIATDKVSISRDAPLDPAQPDMPVWQASADALAAQGAQGINYEPETVGHATGIWDSMAIVRQRLAALEVELAAKGGSKDDTAVAALVGRIAELKRAVANPDDRRVGVRYYVERFAFDIAGANAQVSDPHYLLGELDLESSWSIAFWIGAWDPDLLAAFVQGSLLIPYRGA